jgi:potassium-transporting ATPase KdpC subunit
MLKQVLIGARVTLFMTLVLGIAYPLGVTAICRVFFPRQAGGSLIAAGGRTIGSELIGQEFTRAEYFHPRPSAAGDGYDAANSGASNYGPANPKLAARVQASIEQFRKKNPDATGAVPADLVTASGSGLDPHISPEAAYAQAARVAKARGVDVETVRRMIAAQTEVPDWGILGEARVNVLNLNLALDREHPGR